jgi:penicillin amidase
MKEAVAALDRDFKYGGQNWVIGDDQGNFGWTEVIRVPRRAAGHAPWKVLPVDGSAEWGADMHPRYIPHAYNPAEGFIATANNDPIGVTGDGDPFFGEPVVDGAPLYLGAVYDPGTRIGRIVKRITAMTSGGNKLSLDDLQSIQADAVAEWGEAFLPTLLDAATALSEELASPGSHAELATVAPLATADVKRILPQLLPILKAWTFDTPSGVAEENPSTYQVRDSQATVVTASWIGHYYDAVLGDEIAKLGVDPGSTYGLKLLARASGHPELLRSGIDPTTHDPVVFDNLTTPAIEGKRQIAVGALVGTIGDLVMQLGGDPAAWRWGQLHTLTLKFNVSLLESLQVPRAQDANYPRGFPRHGYFGTVDVAGRGPSTSDFTYASGPAIRFVCELDPANGPRARNALPGGEVFDPTSPHYRDQIELWRKNKTFDLAFRAADVVASANKEYAAHKLGRIRFEP